MPFFYVLPHVGIPPNKWKFLLSGFYSTVPLFCVKCGEIRKVMESNKKLDIYLAQTVMERKDGVIRRDSEENEKGGAKKQVEARKESRRVSSCVS